MLWSARWGSVVALLAASGLTGCTKSVTPPDGLGDAGGLPEEDPDKDGLCNQAERDLGLDTSDPDTDDDGYPDGIESIFGYDPAAPASPERDRVAFLRENRASTAQLTVTTAVDGRGEDYLGAFEALDGWDDLGATAADFFAGSAALYAAPDVNVAVVEGDGERFRGVVGETRLSFEVRLAFGDGVPRLCNRAYPFRYNIKRSDGTLIAAPQFLLVILPPGGNVTDPTWCNTPNPCLL